MAQIRLEHFLLGSKKYIHVSSPVTKLSKAFLLYFGYFFNKDLAFSTRDLFRSSVSKRGIHLALIFLSSICFFKMQWTRAKGKFAILANCLTVYLMSDSFYFMCCCCCCKAACVWAASFSCWFPDLSNPPTNSHIWYLSLLINITHLTINIYRL